MEIFTEPDIRNGGVYFCAWPTPRLFFYADWSKMHPCFCSFFFNRLQPHSSKKFVNTHRQHSWAQLWTLVIKLYYFGQTALALCGKEVLSEWARACVNERVSELHNKWVREWVEEWVKNKSTNKAVIHIQQLCDSKFKRYQTNNIWSIFPTCFNRCHWCSSSYTASHARFEPKRKIARVYLLRETKIGSAFLP